MAVLVAGPERRSGAEDWRRLLGDFASAAGAGALRAIYAAGDDFEVWLAPGGEEIAEIGQSGWQDRAILDFVTASFERHVWTEAQAHFGGAGLGGEAP